MNTKNTKLLDFDGPIQRYIVTNPRKFYDRQAVAVEPGTDPFENNSLRALEGIFGSSL